MMAMSCHSTYSTTANKVKRSPMPKVVFSVDKGNDGNYEIIEIEKENAPEPIQGRNQWVRDFYGSIKYPAKARENGVEGLVILDVEINQNGQVTLVEIKKGISKECDEEAKRAYIHSTQNGYHPLMIDNVPTKFRMELPVGFWLE